MTAKTALAATLMLIGLIGVDPLSTTCADYTSQSTILGDSEQALLEATFVVHMNYFLSAEVVPASGIPCTA
jgi:hypothetical protein